MSEIPLRDVIDNLRSRLQTELEAELAQVADSHDQALAEARRAAEAEAERRWSETVEAVRAEWTERLQAEVSGVRAEAERQTVAEATRARMDAEQAAAEAAAALRREMDEALATAREQAASEQERLEAERRRVEQELNQARAELDAERERSAAAIEAARHAAPALDTPRLLSALSMIGSATSLTEVIRAAITAARAEAPRASLFIVNGAQLDEWSVPGAAALSPIPLRVDGREAGFLAEALKLGEPLVSGPSAAPPAFAGLPAGRRAVAVPFVFGGQPVALLYADEGAQGQAQDGWIDAVEILGRYASATAACITARKAAEAMHIVQGSASRPAAGGPSASEDVEQGARRYARLLVSEIKLYNESAVRTGRQKRDLLQRLRPEIERARRLYEERVAPDVPGREPMFHEELVQTLADGDPSLLS